MTKNTLIEIGYITCSKGLTYTAYASHLTFDRHLEDVTVEGIELELQAKDGALIETLTVPNLSEMPDRFNQRQVNALEEHILSEERISRQAYLQDLYTDSQRSFE